MLGNKYPYIILCLISIISFLGNWFVFEMHNTESLGKFQKLLLIAIWFLVIYVLGYFQLKKSGKVWAVSIWQLQYLFVFIICVVYVELYFVASYFPLPLKTIMASIRNFYLTPFPFALIVIMVLIENKKSNKD